MAVAEQGGFAVAKMPLERDPEDDMRLASLGDDPFAKAIRDAARVVSEKAEADRSRDR